MVSATVPAAVASSVRVPTTQTAAVKLRCVPAASAVESSAAESRSVSSKFLLGASAVKMPTVRVAGRTSETGGTSEFAAPVVCQAVECSPATSFPSLECCTAID